MSLEPCSFCGGEHEMPVGEPGSFLEAVPVCVCPRIPVDHIYVDRAYESGPRGQLIRIADFAEPKGKS